ncbi:hypothetical protein [Neptunomonas sp.]
MSSKSSVMGCRVGLVVVPGFDRELATTSFKVGLMAVLVFL